MKTHNELLISSYKLHLIRAGILMVVISCFFSVDALSQRDNRDRQRNSNQGDGSGRQNIRRDQSIRQQIPGAGSRRGSEAIGNNNLNRGESRRPSQNEFNNRNYQGQSDYGSRVNRGPVNTGRINSNRNTVVITNNPNRQGNNYNRPGNNINPPGSGVYNRPSNSFNNRYRSYNHYNNYRRPVYSAYNPNWCYAYTPRRNSIFNTLPSSYININFGGSGYRYYDGIYYRPYNNIFRVVAPPIGIYINVLPVGYRKISVRNYPYYYYNGTYYDYRNNNYTVVSPPVGAVVESIPDGFETLTIDGETYYTVDGAQYKPVVQENGEIWYEVVKSN